MLSRIRLEDIEVLSVFTDECRQCLDGLEKEILKLEVSSEDAGLLHHIFEKVHRIRRGASFFGLSCITRLGYEVELILNGISEQSVTVDTGLIDSLLSFVDFLNGYFASLIGHLRDKGADGESGSEYLEFEFDHNEEQILEGIKLAHENCKVRNEAQETNEEGFEVLQSEEFNRDLAEGIRDQFLIENMEHVEKIENDLLVRLERNGDDREAISEIFRAVHSIKGGTGIYLATLPPESLEHANLKKLSEVVHTFESLLTLVRDRECKFDNKLVDLSFMVMDCIQAFMQSVASGESIDLPNSDVSGQIQEQISRLEASSNNVSGDVKAASPQLSNTEDAKLKSSSLTQSIRVSQDKIDKMMNMISELLIARNSFMHISQKLNLDYDLPEMSKEVKEVGAYINRISDELQNAIMSIRMVEIRTVFQRMPRIVRDIAQSTGKKMELHMEGENTEIDKTIVELISDPLVHLIRNAADHGIEAPEERLSKAKPEVGRITLRAYNRNKHVFIEIEDDGKGIDAESMKQKAIEKGFITSQDAEKMSRNQLLNLIFMPGFSTAKQITEISGRGVGMDIVRSNIEKISGNIRIESEIGKGTKMIIQLPLSLAVSRGLIVEASGESYIIPLEYIVETVKIKKSSIHKYHGKCFTCLRGEVIRVEWLSRIFMMGERDDEQDELNAVILYNGAENFAIVVDRLKNEQEFVVKTLEGRLASIPGISGSTLLGNGKVVLIINPADLLQLMDD